MKVMTGFVLFVFLCTACVAQNFSVSTLTLDTGGFPPPGDDILVPGPAPILPGVAGSTIDVDGFTYGRRGSIGSTFFFSVDHFSIGLPGTAVDFEVFGSGGGFGEQNVDVFRTNLVTMPGTNMQFHDGNGIGPGGTAFPLGMMEPAFPTVNPLGPGVDGYDTRFAPPPAPLGGSIYWTWNPISGAPASGSGADVLISPTVAGYSGVGAIFAPSFSLGLDLMGTGTDNINALEIFDTGVIGVYDPGDVILFSLDPFSMSLGAYGALPSDVLMATFGGPTGIFLSGTSLGLGSSDNLTALSVVPEPNALFILAIATLGFLRRKK